MIGTIASAAIAVFFVTAFVCGMVCGMFAPRQLTDDEVMRMDQQAREQGWEDDD